MIRLVESIKQFQPINLHINKQFNFPYGFNNGLPKLFFGKNIPEDIFLSIAKHLCDKKKKIYCENLKLKNLALPSSAKSLLGFLSSLYYILYNILGMCNWRVFSVVNIKLSKLVEVRKISCLDIRLSKKLKMRSYISPFTTLGDDPNRQTRLRRMTSKTWLCN